MDLVEIGWGGLDWIGQAQDKGIVNSVVNFRIPQNAVKLEWLHSQWPLQ
jgi:hypothetical protein